MGSPAILNREKAAALQEAIETVERLLGEEGGNERLYSAKHDVVGRSMPDYVMSMLVAELARVVAGQQERLGQLEEALTLKGSGGKKK